ncbi:MAG: helicase-exonuclease AddAB subunit AddA [Clostridia bacterium]|nr:helicase-exonuclease AddAB subunit AddA [Clostridia bacterium]
MQLQQEVGKTAVLVERIINKAINENIDIDKLLVVTFTNAAASEMRERVLDAIYKKLDEDPENENLQKQITLLNMASICTIDSFCLEVVKNNFYELENVSPNFRIADTPEIELLKQEILDELFENKYLSEDKDFTKLINTYTSYRDDTPLKELITNIYNYISSSPYPRKWLNEKIEMFNIEKQIDEDFSNTPWGKSLLQEMDEELIDDIAILTDVLESLEYDKELEDFKQTIETDVKQLNILRQSLDNWDKSYEIAQNLKFVTWPRKKVESEIKDEAKSIRDNVKKKFNKKIDKIFVSDSKQSNQDIYDMYEILKKLENLIIEFDDIFSKRKRDKNIVDFTDIEHFALNILVKDVETVIDENGEKRENIIKTEVAKKYTEKFEEIAIDEYQDSNLVQEFILSSISRGNNMFMVGDVKQSIYRFRQAMPKLFLDKYEEFSNVETVGTIQKCLTGRKIQLFKNFRSRDNILDFTNLIFKNIMSHTLGEVEYDEKEYLNFGAEDYKKIGQNLKTEIDIIDTKKDEDSENTESYLENNYENYDNDVDADSEELEHIENIELEAKYVAKKIKDLIDNKYQVYDRKNECFRDITYKDIAILLRSTKDKASIYEQEMMNLGMPVFSDSNQEYLDSIEIQTIMSLLKVIDNPMQDIPLVTILRSNIGGFTDNELVEIRLSDKYDNFYNCMLKAKVDVKPELKQKIEKFIENIKTWRKEQEYLSLDELIWKIYSDTGYYNYVGLMPNGNLRQANLKMLFERAKKYETASFKGLYNFINFIEKLKTNSGDLSAAKIIGENDDVIRIMSIHKSKGLEFPVVFLVNSNKQFNEQDIRKNPVLLHQEMGIGAKYINYNAQVQYDTLTREAIKNVIRNESISEEMRILYVALTRAKEKLIITGIAKDFTKQIEDIEKQVSIYPRKNGKINPILVKKYKTYLDWILLVYLYVKNNTDNLLELNRINPRNIVDKNIKQEEENDSKKIIKILDSKVHEKDLLNKIKNKIEYEYENKLATTIPTKSSVTKIKQMKEKTVGVDFENLEDSEVTEKKEITFEKPKFLQEEKDIKITSAQKGTLIHLCMQKLNPKEEYDLQKIKELINNLELKQIITEKEADAINPYKILEFTKSNIWEQLKNAKEFYQERPFYINIPAKEIYDEQINENILVQGIIDLYYIDKEDNLVLLDYKTDYVEKGKEAELIEKYKKQLELYKEALEQALDKKVDQIYIYSVYLGKEIKYL